MNFLKFSRPYLVLFTSSIFLVSCESNPTDIKEDSQSILSDRIELIEGTTLKVQSRDALKGIFKDYQKNTSSQNGFNSEVRDLQSKGFKPLTPLFSKNQTEEIREFVLNKKERIAQRNIAFGITSKSTGDEEINLDDELIQDPIFAALLNENREIYIADSLYKYTELGLYFCLATEKQKLYNYLNKLNFATKKKEFTNKEAPCLQEMQKKTSKIMPEDFVSEVSPGVMMYAPPKYCDNGYSNPPTPTPVPVPPTATPRFKKQNLEIAYVETNSIFEHLFGASDKSEDYYSDNRRIQVSFWNQNYYVFSSIGCSARLQKREKTLGVSYWEKSYADQIELGINSIQYDYKFNVPPFNNSLYVSGPTVYYSYKGVNYNQFAQVIPSLPTDNPGFPFDTDNNENVVEIYIFQNDFNLSAKDANKMIDDGLKALAKLMPSNSTNQNELLKGLNSESLKYNIVKAVPFSDKVTFATMGVKWTNNDDNAITHYFDFNFLLTWNSKSTSVGSYLSGLQGSTPYTSVYADIYGAALHNNEWRGRRLIREKH